VNLFHEIGLRHGQRYVELRDEFVNLRWECFPDGDAKSRSRISPHNRAYTISSQFKLQTARFVSIFLGTQTCYLDYDLLVRYKPKKHIITPVCRSAKIEERDMLNHNADTP